MKAVSTTRVKIASFGIEAFETPPSSPLPDSHKSDSGFAQKAAKITKVRSCLSATEHGLGREPAIAHRSTIHHIDEELTKRGKACFPFVAFVIFCAGSLAFPL
jgi:hypothetical protein